MRILSLSGFIPEQICDTVRFIGYKGERNIAHYCGYANDYVSQVLNDTSIDGAIYPRSCDSTRIISSYLSHSKKFQYQLNVPARCDGAAVNFYAKQLERLREAVIDFYGEQIGDLEDRVRLIDIRNELIAKKYSELEKTSYKEYLDAIHADMQCKLVGNEHKNLIREYAQKKAYNHRVYIVGSFMTNTNVAEIIENNGLGIVGDNLPESGRIQGSIIEIGRNKNNLYKAIAGNVLSRRLSPTQDDYKSIIDSDIKEIKKLCAEGVIFISQKYCEPYDYLYSVYKKRLDELFIPTLHISLMNSEDEKKVALSVEAFADML